MNPSKWLKALGIWLLFAVAAPLNGGLRDFVVAPLWGEGVALPLSGVLLAVIIGWVTFLLLPHIGQISPADAWRIGGVWLALMLGFELGLGMLLLDQSLAEVMTVFDVTRGNLYVLALLTVLLAPRLSLMGRRRMGRDAGRF
ncbi:MAG: hypothetical protein GVY15_09770 [Bacteroidetes bacterium]|jgi:hypothetical protein|nr:hypothetical protein [Bacteroidota bacterium]